LSLEQTLLADRYRIERLIARGGMSDVYLAVDERLDRQVAVKVIFPHLAADKRFVDKFIREAKTAAKLNHPNLVNVFDQGTADGQTFMVMEYVPGMTLREALHRFGKLSPTRALELFEAILQGLAAAHRAGILHRDLKPENVFLSDDGRIKLGDFGLAREASAATSTGSLMGTIAYIAPELLTRGHADARSDVYSAGIMLFEFVAGRQPFTGDDIAHIAHQHTSVGISAPSAIAPSVPPLVDELVLWAAARAPEHRPANAQVLMEVAQRVRAEVKAGRGATTKLDLPAFANVAATQVLSVESTMKLPSQLIDSNGTVLIGDTYVPEAGATTVLDDALPVEALSPLEELAVRRRKRGKWIALTMALALLLSMGGGWWFSAGPGGMSALPNLTSSTVANATQVLSQYSGNIKQVREYSSTVSSGLVTRTDPAAGSLFWRGGQITLFVSKGAQLEAVPSLVGLTPQQAADKLQRAGFTAGDTASYFSTEPKGAIFDYLGSDGNPIAIGTLIPLKVSLGPLPNVVGQTQTAATSALQAAGVTVSGVTMDYTDAVSTGQVFAVSQAQDPLPQGGSVTLSVSSGPTTVAVPSMIGETISASQLALKSLGLQVEVNTNQLQSSWGIVKVKSMSIAPGTVVKRGTIVVISSK